jgi:class 3 adenylate cyclase/predicted ATPase
MEDLDPEEAHAVVDPVLRIMVEAVHRYEGYVVRTTGDGIFALFGAPVAHEDHPQRALSAALRLQQELHAHGQGRIAQGLHPLEARVGVHTGEVVAHTVETDGKVEYRLIGHTANLASRMEMVAPTGSIAASEYTRKLCEGYFTFKSLGPMTVKGVSEPVAVYEVTGFGPLRTRLQRAVARGLTKFVGREREMNALRHALEQAQAGHGQIVALMADPGVGKSRLFYEFKATSQHGCMLLEAHSVSHGKASSYVPVIELLRNYFRIVADDDLRQRRQKVIGKLLELDRSLEDVLPYLLALLGLNDGDDPIAHMDAQIRRRRTQEGLKRIFIRESLQQPLIMIFEDLHWIDTETQGVLNLLAESIANARILLMVNYRPEYRHDWGHRAHYTQLRLDPLGDEGAQAMLTALLGDGANLATLRRLVLERTQGNPFFIEEIVQGLFDEGVVVRNGAGVQVARALSQVHIPTTVQGVLASRIDRLPPDEKQLLQALAVMGREFPLPLVQRFAQSTEDALEAMLSSLQSADFINEEPAFPDIKYTFKHALTQEVAYNSLLAERRQLIHQQIGEAMESWYGERLDDHLKELALHYSRSRNTAKAIEYLQLAGQQSAQRSANAEAIGHLTAALALLRTLPDTRERAQRELLLHLTFGPVWIATKGYAAPEVERAYLSARDFCLQLGETTQLFVALWGLSACYVTQAKFDLARELGEQFLHLARSQQELTVSLEAYRQLGFTLMWAGECGEARACLEQGIALYHPQHHRALISQYGEDAGVYCLAFVSQALWALGYPEQAVKSIQGALSLAREVAHPYSLTLASLWSAFLHQFRREARAAYERSQEVITLAAEHGFPLYEALGTILQGGASVEQGRQEEGIAQVRRGQTAWEALGAEIMRPYYLALLAEGYGKLGQTNEGLILVGEALEAVCKTGERFYEAELYRLKGTLILESGVRGPASGSSSPQTDAEACLYQAIEIAQRQQAKSWELRATLSLSRLLMKQGGRDEALSKLAEIYNWFTEGFDTADLKEAKALLDELKS